MVEDKLVLELGYCLISLVNKTEYGLINTISNLRKQKPYLPIMRIKDNMALAPYEFSINGEKHILESKNDNSGTQIISLFITQYVEAHPEIQDMKRTI